MLPILAAVAIFYIFMFRGRNKERGKFEQMLKDLKRNDRVQTIGGMLGTVVEVRDNEVVLKIDEASNTKVRVTRGAIKEVIAPAAEEQK
jgi:preprotein translocase subunit YajC